MHGMEMIGILSNKGKERRLRNRLELECERFEHYCELYKKAKRMEHKKLMKHYFVKALQSRDFIKKLAGKLNGIF